ncbi:threonine synthase [Paenibacillus sp. MBLB4367]|uniref:threonine synthase n=1 Tax=Paenibacillus sp. MBLB4367 TaxID=3384767 RepID=UPI00390829B5
MERFLLTCTRCGNTEPFDVKGKCGCGGTFLVEYDLPYLRKTWNRESLARRPWTMWRYRELLPVRQQACPVTLGEGGTPLLRLTPLERRLGLGGLYSKREEINPTGSFKARGFSVAVTLLQERGIRKVAVNSNGNAASALAAYAACAGMEAFVFVPMDCPGLIVEEAVHYGARVFLVDGLIQDAGRIVGRGIAEQGWFHAGTLREPGRAEGKKTMGLEVAEQLGWAMPNVILYPTGGGSGIVGLWRAFAQLKELGWVQGDLPRLVSVQESGCEPIVRLLHDREGDSAAPCDGGSCDASPTGLLVPEPPDGKLIASILKQSGGDAIAVTREEIRQAQCESARMGLSASPEGAAAFAGLFRLCERRAVLPGETVVCFNTSHAAKYWPWQCHTSLPVVRCYEDVVFPSRQTGR